MEAKDKVMSQSITETAFSYNIEDALYKLGWRWMHPRPARVRRHGRDIYETAYSGHKGWLDYFAIRAPRILVFELKDDKANMTPEQEEWFAAWLACQKDNPFLEVYLWRPKQFCEILEVLK